MRAIIAAAVIAATGIIAAGCGGSGQATTQASTAGTSACQRAVNDLFAQAEANATSTDTSVTSLFAEAAFATCKTPSEVDQAIGVWLDEARSAGKDVADSTASEIAGQRELICDLIGQGAPEAFCG